MRRIYREGQCRRCGRRVTVSRENSGHTRDEEWCGPIETDKPFEVADQNWPGQWRVPDLEGKAR